MPFSDQFLDSVTWEQVERFAKSLGEPVGLNSEIWKNMELEERAYYLSRFESLCGKSIRLDTMTPEEVFLPACPSCGRNSFVRGYCLKCNYDEEKEINV